MSMSLTKDDLQAIKQVVEHVVEEAIEDAKQQAAAGFAEVHKKIGKLEAKIVKQVHDVDLRASRLERVVVKEVDRTNDHGLAIKKIRKALHAA